jgi:hypothetical protein
MSITSNDIAAQRAMLERGEYTRLRDSFAAAALTGLLSNIQTYQLVAVTRQAYDLADEMLIQRSPRLGASAADKAIQDAKDFARIREQVEAWQKEASAHSGRSPISHDRRVPQSSTVGVAEMDSATDRKSAATPRACASSCSQPFDSAPTTHDAVPEAKATTTPLNEGAACNTATSGTGDTRESLSGSLPCYLGDGVSPSHNEKNLRHTQRPVAWARFYPNGGPQSVYLDRPPADAEPLYRSPTLTDAERQLFVRLEERFESLAHFFDTPSGVNRQAKEACDRDRKILKALTERLS